MPCHFLTNFEIQTYYQNEPKYNCAYSRNNLPNTKGGAHVVNLDEYESIGSHWTLLYVNGDNIIHFDSSGVEHLPKEMEKLAGNKNNITNIYKIKACDLIMSGYFCIGFIDFISIGKSLLDYGNLFSPNENEENDNIILKYFQ